MSANLVGAYSYDKDLTPRITSVIPSRGSTAGGTDITISGSGFGSIAEGVSVTIVGVPCAITSVSANEVQCTTGNHGPTNSTHQGKGPVMLQVAPKGYATAAADTYWYVDLWSRTTTWGGGPPPIEGDSVEIPRGQTVLLDISPPQLVAIVVMGKLVFDRKDLTLQAGYIIILGDGATLEVGTEEQPFLQKATITLYGHPKSPELPVYGAKVIALREGTLDLHGKPLLRSWTMLAATGAAGDTSLTLMKPVDWDVGADIVIASTDFYKEHAEQVTITGLSADGLTVSFTPAFKYQHLGETRVAGGHPFELRAEVGILTRNVRVMGDVCSHTCSSDFSDITIGDGVSNRPVSIPIVTLTLTLTRLLLTLTLTLTLQS